MKRLVWLVPVLLLAACGPKARPERVTRTALASEGDPAALQLDVDRGRDPWRKNAIDVALHALAAQGVAVAKKDCDAPRRAPRNARVVCRAGHTTWEVSLARPKGATTMWIATGIETHEVMAD